MGAERAPAYGGACAQMLGNGLKRDPRAPSGARGGPIVEDRRRHFRRERSETA